MIHVIEIKWEKKYDCCLLVVNKRIQCEKVLHLALFVDSNLLANINNSQVFFLMFAEIGLVFQL